MPLRYDKDLELRRASLNAAMKRIAEDAYETLKAIDANNEAIIQELNKIIDDLQQTNADMESELNACKAKSYKGGLSLPNGPVRPVKPKPVIGVIIGHDSLVKGAYSEHLRMAEWDHYEAERKRLKLYLGTLNNLQNCHVIPIHRDRRGIASAHEKLVAAKIKFDAVIEFHFNAFNGEAHGSEIIVDADYDGNGLKFFATELNDRWCAVTGLRNRGVKLRKDGERGYFNVSNYKDAPYFLVEPFFGDNAEDVTKIKNVNVMEFFVNTVAVILNAGVYTDG